MAVIIPGATWQPRNPPISTVPIGGLRWIILHTVVGTVNGSISGGHYHVYVRANGEYIQIQDLALRSAASVEANPYSIAIVAEDKGPAFPVWTGGDVPDYTPQQKESIAFCIDWITDRYGLPKQYVQTSRLGEMNGVAHHRFGIDGNFPATWPLWGRQSGGQSWSLSVGKYCTGDRRIRSGIAIVEALQEDDLTPEQDQRLKNIERVLITNRVSYEGDQIGAGHDLASRIIETAHRVGAARVDETDQLAPKNQTIAEVVAAELAKLPPPAGGGVTPAQIALIAEAVGDELSRRLQA